MYSREIDDETLTLSASGWTYRSTFVLYDFETETLWYHPRGDDGLTGISGVYEDRKLPEFESTKTRWNTWRDGHSDTGFLRYP